MELARLQQLSRDRRSGARIVTLVACCVCLFLVAVAESHDASGSESRLTIAGHQVRAALVIDLLAVKDVDRNDDKRVSYDELDARLEAIYAGIKEHFRIAAPNPPIRTAVERYEVVLEHLLRLEIMYEFDRPPTSITVTSTLDVLTQPTHRHVTALTVNGSVQQAVLESGARSVVFRDLSAGSRGQVIRFVQLGLERISAGDLELAFIVGLIAAAVTMRSLIRVLVPVAIAHTLALGRAGFKVV
jgi:hypothetical protein